MFADVNGQVVARSFSCGVNGICTAGRMFVFPVLCANDRKGWAFRRSDWL